MTHKAQHPQKDPSGDLDQDQSRELAGLSEQKKSEVDTVAVIVAEVRDSEGTESAESIKSTFQKRLQESGIELSSEDVAELVTQIRTGIA